MLLKQEMNLLRMENDMSTSIKIYRIAKLGTMHTTHGGEHDSYEGYVYKIQGSYINTTENGKVWFNEKIAIKSLANINSMKHPEGIRYELETLTCEGVL